MKPGNFLMGLVKKGNLCTSLTLGCPRRTRMSPHQYISYCVNKDLMGTARYSSINMHLGISEPHGRTWHQFTHLPGFEDGDWASLALRVFVACALTISFPSLSRAVSEGRPGVPGLWIQAGLCAQVFNLGSQPWPRLKVATKWHKYEKIREKNM